MFGVSLIVVSVHNAGGAMENWGLVIYKMDYLLFEKKTSGIMEKAQVTAGECAFHDRRSDVLIPSSCAA